MSTLSCECWPYMASFLNFRESKNWGPGKGCWSCCAIKTRGRDEEEARAGKKSCTAGTAHGTSCSPFSYLKNAMLDAPLWLFTLFSLRVDEEDRWYWQQRLSEGPGELVPKVATESSKQINRRLCPWDWVATGLREPTGGTWPIHEERYRGRGRTWNGGQRVNLPECWCRGRRDQLLSIVYLSFYDVTYSTTVALCNLISGVKEVWLHACCLLCHLT